MKALNKVFRLSRVIGSASRAQDDKTRGTEKMTIIELLERNAREWPDDTALVEINPDQPETRRVTWHDFELVEPSAKQKHYRREITWAVFDEKANRVANMLLEQGISRGQKCAVLMMNCLEWLPIYFGILKAGAVAVPLNFRFTSDEIDYCLKLADVDVLFYGPEFIGRIEDIAGHLKKNTLLYFVGDSCPSYAQDYYRQVSNSSSCAPRILIEDTDDELRINEGFHDSCEAMCLFEAKDRFGEDFLGEEDLPEKYIDEAREMLLFHKDSTLHQVSS